MNVRRLSGAAAGILLLAAAGAACSSDESVFNAEVGECVESISDLSGNISELPETECTEDHEGEIFFLFQHSGDDDDFPGSSELQAEAAEDCEGDAFEDYMGVPYAETTIAVAQVNPSEDSWGEGDRETICIAGLPGDTVDESFKDNGEDFPLEGSGTDEEESTDEEEDTSLADFADEVEACEGGDLAGCDSLWAGTPPGSEAEEVGATCGGREDELPADFIPGSCEEILG